jgi:hypothetical protein
MDTSHTHNGVMAEPCVDTPEPSLAEIFVQTFPTLWRLESDRFLVAMAPFRALVKEHTGINLEANEYPGQNPGFTEAPYYVTYCRLCRNLDKPNIFQRPTKKARTGETPDATPQ